MELKLQSNYSNYCNRWLQDLDSPGTTIQAAFGQTWTLQQGFTDTALFDQSVFF
jgi:hypothetical protein